MTQVLPPFLLKNQRTTPPMAAEQMNKPVAGKQGNAILQSQQHSLPAQLGESSMQCAGGTLKPSNRRLL